MNKSLTLTLNTYTRRSRLLALLAVLFSGPGTFIIFPLLFCAFVFVEREGRWESILLTALVLFFSWLFAEGIKHVLKAPRPFKRDRAIVALTLPRGFSFPSEHAAVYGALATIAFSYGIWLGLVFSLIALSIGFSRMMLGVHYLRDVVAGLMLGVIIAELCKAIL